MKLPRDLDAIELVKLLKKFDYVQIRQSGSHIRLTRKSQNEEHHITIPKHNPIKIGTLSGILKDISSYLKVSKDDLINELFS